MALSLLAAAPGVYQCDTITPSTATLFTYEDKGTYKKVTSTQCSQTYILSPRGETAPDLSSESADYLYFGVPLQNVAVTQTVTNTFLETLGVRDKISVVSEYSTSSCMAPPPARAPWTRCSPSTLMASAMWRRR